MKKTVFLFFFFSSTTRLGGASGTIYMSLRGIIGSRPVACAAHGRSAPTRPHRCRCVLCRDAQPRYSPRSWYSTGDLFRRLMRPSPVRFHSSPPFIKVM
eukprot:2347821-Prymnesium_polylepis.2